MKQVVYYDDEEIHSQSSLYLSGQKAPCNQRESLRDYYVFDCDPLFLSSSLPLLFLSSRLALDHAGEVGGGTAAAAVAVEHKDPEGLEKKEKKEKKEEEERGGDTRKKKKE